MPARRKGDRLLPPGEGLYEHGNGYRFVRRRADGSQSPSPVFLSRKAALEAKREEQAMIDGRTDVTIASALDEYEVEQRQENQPLSVDTTLSRLRRTFALVLDNELGWLTVERCQAIYDRLQVLVGERTGKPIKPATHRNMLAEAKTFLRWCMGKRYMGTNPMEGIRGKGRVSKGKKQLRIDEARLWKRRAHIEAGAGEEGAVAAMLTLFLGLRASEVVRRKVRDLDDNGTKLVIEDAKTPGSNGTFDVPEEVREYLKALTVGKPPTASLWNDKHDRNWPRKWVKKICVRAGVPEVTAHGMRGLFMTLALVQGLGALQEQTRTKGRHTKFATTKDHYLAAGALRSVTQALADKALRGGN